MSCQVIVSLVKVFSQEKTTTRKTGAKINGVYWLAGSLVLLVGTVVALATAADTPESKPLATRVQSYNKVAVDRAPWGSLRWLMNAKLDSGAGLTLGVVELNAGQSNPLHVHANCEEVVYVISGTCEHRVGKETVTLKAGDVLRIPRGVPHMAKALGNEPSRSIVVYNTGERQFTTVHE